MPGADAKVKKLVKELSLMSWPARAARLDQVALEYGKGFADTIRREVEKRVQPEPK